MNKDNIMENKNNIYREKCMSLTSRALKEYKRFKLYPLNAKNIMENNGFEEVFFLSKAEWNEYLDAKKKVIIPFISYIISKELLLPNNPYYKSLMKILTKHKSEYNIDDLIKYFLNQSYYLSFSMMTLNLIYSNKGELYFTKQEKLLTKMESDYMNKIMPCIYEC